MFWSDTTRKVIVQANIDGSDVTTIVNRDIMQVGKCTGVERQKLPTYKYSTFDILVLEIRFELHSRSEKLSVFFAEKVYIV